MKKLAICALFFCFVNAFAQSTTSFGVKGFAGHDGRSGQDGRDGQNVALQADGRPYYLDISGTHGQDGENGNHGESARDCSQPLDVAENLRGAAGGKGGDGGNGGNGGNAGSLRVHYLNQADLMKIELDARPGRGGRAGKYGEGGNGCKCTVKEWVIAGVTYNCKSGAVGAVGKQAEIGKDGTGPKFQLIPQMDDVGVDQPSIVISVKERFSSPFKISLNQWRDFPQGQFLFNNRSRIEDGSFILFDGTKKLSVDFIWDSSRDPELFANEQFQLSLSKTGNFETKKISSGWFIYNQQQESPNHFSIRITDALKISEVNALEVSSIITQGSDVIVTVVDKGGLMAKLKDSWSLRFGTYFMFGSFRTRFQSALDPAIIQVAQNSISFSLVKAGVPLKFLKKGTKVQVEVFSNRSFGSNSMLVETKKSIKL